MSTAQQRTRWAGIFSRDTITYVGGWYLIIYQAQFAPTFNSTAFVAGVLIALVPGTLAAWALRQAALLTPTDPPSSGSLPGQSSAQPP